MRTARDGRRLRSVGQVFQGVYVVLAVALAVVADGGIRWLWAGVAVLDGTGLAVQTLGFRRQADASPDEKGRFPGEPRSDSRLIE